ncbi:MAG TPA: AbrB/MazE/SpoVT family DNA-binding domain-containing protein [Afifellaceae bacterium]|jgi:antitoxin VapB|nr:AbrB/MazE/SpoVT family DNA-binding domain-containing protein [Afifellaceae bacterium]
MQLGNERRAKVFRNGRSRAIRIPKDLDFEGDEVIVRKEDDGRLSIEPLPVKLSPKELIEWLRSQPPLDVDPPEIEDFPPEPIDLERRG